MKTRDYRLTVDGEYNMKAIVQRAWFYVRNYGYTLKSAMQMSWTDAHIAMEDSEREMRIQNEGVNFPDKNLSVSSLYSNPVGG